MKLKAGKARQGKARQGKARQGKGEWVKYSGLFAFLAYKITEKNLYLRAGTLLLDLILLLICFTYTKLSRHTELGTKTSYDQNSKFQDSILVICLEIVSTICCIKTKGFDKITCWMLKKKNVAKRKTVSFIVRCLVLCKNTHLSC